VTGRIVTADGKPSNDATIIVFAQDPERWAPGSRFIRSARPRSDGSFSITGLVPGSYRALARQYVIDGQWENSEFLSTVVRDAVSLSVQSDQPAVIELKLPRQ
jgi:hypothetical protein